MSINYLCWETIKSRSWRWKIADGTGDDAMFVKEVHISNLSFETSYAYKGFSWESFYKYWQDSLKLVKEVALNTQFTAQVCNWVDWVSHNNSAAEKEVFEQHFRPLSFKSRETFLSVFEKYSEQFNILIEDCVDYEECETVIGFLEDLPHEIIETMSELKASEEVPGEVRVSYGRSNIMQEDTYTVSKMLVSKPTSSFIWEEFKWNKLNKPTKRYITSLFKR